MSIDFKANRIRGYAIIASGTLPDSPAFLIYGSGSATDFAGTVSGNLLSNVGSDTFLFVSGAIGQKNTKYSKSTTVLGGDVVISGTLYNGAGTAYSTSGAGIGGADKNVQYNNAGSLAGSNNLNFDGTNLILTGSSLIKGSLYPSGTVGITGSLVIKDDTADTAQLTLSSSAGNTIFNMYNDGTFYLTNNKSSGQIAVGVTQPDTAGSQVLKIYPKNSQQSLSVFNESLAGSSAASPSASADTNFFVNGLVASKGTSNRGTAVFGGDTVISGSAYLGTSNTDILVVNSLLASDIIPDGNRTRNLGSDTARFANVYTGDLHLRNERGDYTLIEEEDCLTIRFNKNGKRYKFLLERAPEYDE